MIDHYTTLGVARDASPEDIKRAYRRLASQHHPDKGGDTKKFQEVQTAYDTLSDPAKRAAYDNPARPFEFPDFGGGNPSGVNIHDLFGMFGQGFGTFQHHPRRTHVRMNLVISLRDVAEGGRRTVSVSSSQGQSTIEITIPPGINDNDNVHYDGLAPGGQDLVVCFRIRTDPTWSRNALDLTRTLNISVWDLILGKDVNVQNILGHQLTISIPPRSQPGTLLRVRGQGLRDQRGSVGDMFLRLQATIPQQISAEIIEAIQKNRE